jgi:hypothetical protein
LNDITKGVLIPASVMQWLLPAFRTMVFGTCALAWTMWLDVRDLKNRPEPPPALTVKDWEYERRLLLLEQEQLQAAIQRLEMKLEELDR